MDTKLSLFVVCMVVLVGVFSHGDAARSPRDTRDVMVSEKYTKMLFRRYGEEGALPLAKFEKMLDAVGLEEMAHHDDHEDDHRQKRSAPDDHKQDANCSSLDSLQGEFGYNLTTSALDTQRFGRLCPALMYFIDSGACDHDHHEREEKVDDRNMALVWFYMMVGVTLISWCAIFGILFIPKKSRSSYMRVIQFLMALAAGTMGGDGLLHLLPHAMMPPHDHDHDHDHHHEEEEGGMDEHTNALLKGLMAVIGVYAFFFLERGFAIYKLVKEKQMREQEMDENAMSMMTNNHTKDGAKVDGSGCHHHGMIPDLDGKKETPRSCWRCPQLTPLALMIILGDLFHNFCDGLAIGAAFASSTTIGVSTSIAVFTHELPHEIGDFAVLIQSGLSKKEAVILNFLSALSCYIGAVIGIFLGDVGNAPLWIFAGVGGMFLYIALVDLVPEMTRIYVEDTENWVVYLCLHAAGLFSGALLMFILGLYEHDISTALD